MRTGIALPLATLLVAFLASSPAFAGGNDHGKPFEELQSQIDTLATEVAALQAAIGSGGGDVFVHWGSEAAPDATSLIYSGFGYSSHYDRVGMPALVISSAASSPVRSSVSALFFPIVTAGPIDGISSETHLKGAVCLAPRPVSILWGTDQAPSGWDLLYRGTALGPHYTFDGPGDLICVDTEDYDDSSPASPPLLGYALMYEASVQRSAPGDGGLESRTLRCAVVMKQ